MIPRCLYCFNLDYAVRIKLGGPLYDKWITWNSCGCLDHADDYEKVRNKYLQEVGYEHFVEG